MQIFDIMKTEIPLNRELPGIDGDLDIFDLNPNDIPSDTDKVAVLDKNRKIFGTIRTDRLQYLAQKRNQDCLPLIMDYFDEAIIAVDKDGRVFFANRKCNDILVPLSRLMANYMQRVEPGATLIKALKAKQIIINEKNYIKGIDKYVSARFYPLYRGGEFRGAFGIFKDVTELTELNKEVSRVSNIAEEYARQIEAERELKNLEIVGRDKAFIKLITQTIAVAKTDATVLICGENGVGKDIVARLIHKNSERKNMPLITINCAAIPETLIESELFGYEAGSFTGAKKGGQIGKFQLADGGTLFLDEIGDMPLSMQSKLLRALQENEIEKIGSGKTIPIDVRVIAATNQQLEELIEAGKFRRDLFYRLNVVTFNIPPLRERPHDILLLADFFLGKYNKKYRKNVKILHTAYRALENYDWPGNVRELQSCIERVVILNNSSFAEEDDFLFTAKPRRASENTDTTLNKQNHVAQEEQTPLSVAPEYSSLASALKECERKILEDALVRANGDRGKAIELLGVSRRMFYRKLHAHDILLKNY